jgi:hypothetical protein
MQNFQTNGQPYDTDELYFRGLFNGALTIWIIECGTARDLINDELERIRKEPVAM